MAEVLRGIKVEKIELFPYHRLGEGKYNSLGLEKSEPIKTSTDEALDTNWEGKENIRLMMKNISRFDAPDSPSEKWAIKLRDQYVHTCKCENTSKHHLIINLLSSNIPATPCAKHGVVLMCDFTL